MISKVDLQVSYSHCRQIAWQEARNFYYSFLILPKAKRDAMCAIYAFMRTSDNLSDDEGSIQTKQEALNKWRTLLRNAYNGEYENNLIFPAFHYTVQQYNIPIDYFEELINGAEMDLSVSSYKTFDELYKYCYRVAGIVGLVCIHIYGFHDNQAKVLAEACGIGFQLTNILRDLEEDARMGRVYLPEEDLERFNYTPEDLKKSVVDNRFISLMKFQVERAQSYYEQARPLIGMIDPPSRPALSAMIGIYRGILNKITAKKHLVFGDRVRLSALEKLAVVAKACWHPFN